MNGDEVFDLLLRPVDVALILTDRAKLIVIEEHRVVAMAVKRGAKSLHCFWLVFVVAFDQKIRFMARERAPRPGEDGELGAFDIDFDEPDVGEIVVIDPASLDLELIGPRNDLGVELVIGIDRRPAVLGAAVVGIR